MTLYFAAARLRGTPTACARLSKTDLNLGFAPRRERCQGSALYSCFQAGATVGSPRRPDTAHSTDDGKGTMPLLEQSFGGEAPAANFFLRESSGDTTNSRLAL